MEQDDDSDQKGSGLVKVFRRLFRIAGLVLRGYLSGQPIDDERPRKGCC
ncbi:MAG: hypothetical protein ACOYLN_08655 [Blastocatellia bacterium]|jgi:hypothetical protein